MYQISVEKYVILSLILLQICIDTINLHCCNQIFFKKFGDFKNKLYLCTRVFHSIRFKVNKGLWVTAVTLFLYIPHLKWITLFVF